MIFMLILNDLRMAASLNATNTCLFSRGNTNKTILQFKICQKKTITSSTYLTINPSYACKQLRNGNTSVHCLVHPKISHGEMLVFNEDAKTCMVGNRTTCAVASGCHRLDAMAYRPSEIVYKPNNGN